MNHPRENAIERHPTLAGAYASLSAIGQHTRIAGLSAEQQSKVLVAVRENIAKSIRRGHYPEIDARDHHDAASERSQVLER